jgi:hypothetical protein
LLLKAEVVAAVGDEHPDFLEAALVNQQVQPLSGRQLALHVLLIDPSLAASKLGLFLESMELVYLVGHLVQH